MAHKTDSAKAWSNFLCESRLQWNGTYGIRFGLRPVLAEQSAQSTNKINRSQMCVSLQHPQFFVPADGAHLGNIEPALE